MAVFEGPLTAQLSAYIQQRAATLSGTSDSTNSNFRKQAAIVAATEIAERVNQELCLAQERSNPAFVEPVTPEEALTRGIGYCGMHSATFQAVVAPLGIPVRLVQVFWESPDGARLNHIFPEVFWDGKWHMFDISSRHYAVGGLGANDVLSFAEVTAASPRPYTLVTTDPDWPANPRDFMELPGVDVLYDGIGAIHPYVVTQTAERISYSLDTLMGFVGSWTLASGSTGDVTYELDVPAGFTTLEVGAGAMTAGGKLIIDGQSYRMPLVGTGSYAVDAGPLRISFDADTVGWLPVTSLALRQPGATTNDIFVARVGGPGTASDAYDGGAGIDAINYASATQSVSIDLSSQRASGAEIGSDVLSSFENAIAGNGHDRVVGDALPNRLEGGGGNDQLIGQGGNDRILGGSGTDVSVYNGGRSDYLIGRLADGSLRIQDQRSGSPDGVDIAWGVEHLVFSDGGAVRYDALGRYDAELVVQANGNKIWTDVDQADQFSWTTYQEGWTAGRQEWGLWHYDNGTTAWRATDPNNVSARQTYDEQWDAQGRFSSSITVYDDGRLTWYDIDQANEHSWRSYQEVYDANGALQGHQYIYDDGSTVIV